MNSTLNMSSVVGGMSPTDALDQGAMLVDRAMGLDYTYLDPVELLQVPKHSKYFFKQLYMLKSSWNYCS